MNETQRQEAVSLSCRELYGGDCSALWRRCPFSVHSGPASVFVQELVSVHPSVSPVLCDAAEPMTGNQCIL